MFIQDSIKRHGDRRPVLETPSVPTHDRLTPFTYTDEEETLIKEIQDTPGIKYHNKKKIEDMSVQELKDLVNAARIIPGNDSKFKGMDEKELIRLAKQAIIKLRRKVSVSRDLEGDFPEL